MMDGAPLLCWRELFSFFNQYWKVYVAWQPQYVCVTYYCSSLHNNYIQSCDIGKIVPEFYDVYNHLFCFLCFIPTYFW